MVSRKVGFVGLGVMGKPMAFNLLKAEYELVVYDINPIPVQELVNAGASAAASPKEVAKSCPIVITMLRNSADVETAVCGENGILEGIQPDSILVDMSTIDPLVSRHIASLISEKGASMLDAPVSGGEPKAKDGTLTIIVGGNKEVVEKCKDILNVMGKNVIHVGDVGMGETVKLANQVLVGVNAVAVAEAFLFGIRLGADPQTLYRVITASTGNSYVLQNMVPYPGITEGSPANRNFQPGFTTELMSKDLDLILSAATKLDTPLLITSIASQLYHSAKACGLAKKDFTSISTLVKKLVDSDLSS